MNGSRKIVVDMIKVFNLNRMCFFVKNIIWGHTQTTWTSKGVIPNVYANYINLCSKLVYGMRKGSQKISKSCVRSLNMAPFQNEIFTPK